MRYKSDWINRAISRNIFILFIKALQNAPNSSRVHLQSNGDEQTNGHSSMIIVVTSEGSARAMGLKTRGMGKNVCSIIRGKTGQPSNEDRLISGSIGVWRE